MQYLLINIGVAIMCRDYIDIVGSGISRANLRKKFAKLPDLYDSQTFSEFAETALISDPHRCHRERSR